MRQLVFVEPGRAEWREAPEPALQGPGEAIVRPLAVAACDLDGSMMRGAVPFQGPFPLGHEFVAEVVEAGDDAGVEPGDRRIVTFQVSCGECARCRAGLTGNCTAVPAGAMYGIGQVGGDFGGALADLVRVPFARAMLFPLPDGASPIALASVSDNVADGWRTVAPQLAESPGAPVLIVGGGAPSISLYACQVAAALGAERVDFVDGDPDRLTLAERLGANPLEGPPPERLGPYPITVDASADPAGLAAALRSTEPGGTCTSVGIYFGSETPVPLFEMYVKGITFRTGRVDSAAALPHVLSLVADGRLDPAAVTTSVVPFDDAPSALADPPTKLVLEQ
jgi:threonine dehydrogenase-like Zn-dependent dehydrogenase